MSGFGRGRTTSDSDVGLTGGTNSENQRASVMGVMPEHGWATGVGGRFGVTTGSAVVRIAFGTLDGSGNPGPRVQYSQSFTVNNIAVDAGTCQKYTANMAGNAQMWSGTTYYVAFSHTGNPLYHQMAQSANVSYTDENMYFRSTSLATPTDPFGATRIGYSEGIITIYIEYVPNVAPDTPTAGLAPTGFSTTATPTFTANFTDGNTAQGDGLNQYQIEVRQGSSTGTLKWSSGSLDATSGEKTANAVSRVYGGTALAVGTTYFWKIRVSDKFNTWSQWSAWQSFTVNAGGTVSAPTAPTGVQQTVQPSPFTATWSHGSALSTQNVEITLYDSASGGSVVRGPKQVAKTVANGGTISLTWADTAFADLTPGATYYTTIRGQDTGGLWSPPSARTAFSINTPPTTPALQSPADGATIGFVPKLIALSTDPDDTVATGFAVTARIKNAAGTVLQSRAMTLNTGVTPNQWEYQTVYGTSEVQRITRAGTVTGGTFTVTVPANVLGGPFTTAAINYNDAAATIQSKIEALANVGVGNVTVTGGPINTATTIDITFKGALNGIDLSQITVASSLTGTGVTLTPSTVSNGVANDLPNWATYKWDAIATDGTFTTGYSPERTFVFGNGPVVTITSPTDGSTVTTNTPTLTWSTTGQVKKQIVVKDAATGVVVYDSLVLTDSTPSYTIPTGYLYNNKSYVYTVTITNATPLSGSSLPTTFTVSYPTPAAIANFQASPNVAAGAVLLSWDAPNDPPELFSEYTVTAKDLSTGTTDRIARLASVAQVSFEYSFPKANTTYEFGIAKTVYTGSLEKITSNPATAQTSLPLRFPCFTSVLDGGDSFVSCQLLTDFSADDNDDTEYVQTWGSTKPTAVVGGAQYLTASASFMLISDQYGSARDKYAAMKALRDRRTLVCYRDDRGLKIFGYITFRIQYREIDRIEIEVTFNETYYAENVA